ncbi:MAG: DHHW family protein [Bacillus sp. (in: firmicutes)]
MMYREHVGGEMTKQVISGLSKNFSVINNSEYFTDTFTSEEMEDMYYKTDHHWNHLGTYESYKRLFTVLSEEHSEILGPLEK